MLRWVRLRWQILQESFPKGFSMGKRRSSRKTALQFLYQIDSELKTSCEDVSWARSNFERFCSFYHPSTDSEILQFAFLLCRGVIENLTTLDHVIENSSHNWNVSRMSVIDRNILRFSAYEMIFLSDIPTPVTINEAIEVAREFGSESSTGFVNGILDRLRETLEKEEVSIGSDSSHTG